MPWSAACIDCNIRTLTKHHRQETLEVKVPPITGPIALRVALVRSNTFRRGLDCVLAPSP